MQYHPDTDDDMVSGERTGQDTESGIGATRKRHTPWRDCSVTLQMMTSGMLAGVTLSQFMDSIDVANHQLGNRAFLRWVESLQAEEPGAAIRAVGVPGRPPTAPLQLMPKKRKKKTEGVETPEGQQEELPDTAAVASEAPTRLDAGAGPEPQDPSLQAPSEEAAVAVAKKKKKKSRVQVALNTLRAEGVEAFRSYLEVGIGETELLRTLTERISRAENLGSVKDAALGFVAARLRALDPEAGAAMPTVTQDTAIPAIARAKIRLRPRELEIYRCVRAGNAVKLRSLLRFGAVDVNELIGNGTLLSHACHQNHTAVVRELLSAPGIDVNLAQKDGATPLYFAAQEGHVDIVKLLLAAPDIKPNLIIRTRTTPLNIAAQRGRMEVITQLLKHPDTLVDAQQYDGATPLFCAAQSNYQGIVELLLRSGANVNLPLNDGGTPLGSAAKYGHIEVVRILLRQPEIQVNSLTVNRVTPLNMASQNGYKDIVKILLRKGANPNIANEIGITPLHVACLHGHTAIVEILLHAGADIFAEVMSPDLENFSPHDIAYLVGENKIVALLASRIFEMSITASRLERVTLEDKPERSTSPTTPMLSSPPGAIGQSPRPDEAAATTAALVGPDSQPMPEATHDPLETAKQALRQEVLGKLKNDNLESLEGIRLLVDINRTGDIDTLCRLYNRLAHIERQKEHTRRRKPSRSQAPAPGAEAALPYTGAPRFALEDRQDLDADAIEGEIRRRLAPSRHRFVSQAVNNMEFGRGKLTSVYPGLLHVSAGIPGVGSCSVFYYGDATQNRIRIVGIGHHLDRGTYRLVYATGELRGRRTLSLL